MCKSTEHYMKYDQCLLNPGKGIAGQISSHLSSRPNMQHHIKTKVIHLCHAARERPDQSRCSVIQDLVEGAVLEEPAYSSYAGPCPACEAAQNATNQTIIVRIQTSAIGRQTDLSPDQQS